MITGRESRGAQSQRWVRKRPTEPGSLGGRVEEHRTTITGNRTTISVCVREKEQRRGCKIDKLSTKKLETR